MPIRPITRQQFEALGLPGECRTVWRSQQETEWYADDQSSVAGALVLNPLSLRWSYVICRRAAEGAFQHAASGVERRIQKQAQQELLARMQSLAAGASER